MQARLTGGLGVVTGAANASIVGTTWGFRPNWRPRKAPFSAGEGPMPGVGDGVPTKSHPAEDFPYLVGAGAARDPDVGVIIRGRRERVGAVDGGAWRAHRGHRHGVSAEAEGRAARARPEAVPS